MEGKNEKSWQPEPAESFGIEFLNARGIAVKDAMSSIGNFDFRSSGPLDDDSVYYEGERFDGTKIRIEIKKGPHYKSPKELADERKLEKEN